LQVKVTLDLDNQGKGKAKNMSEEHTTIEAFAATM